MPSNDNDVALRGFDADRNELFAIRRKGNALDLDADAGADPKAFFKRVVRLDFMQTGTDRRLFVWPFLPDTFELKAAGGQVELSGTIRCLVPAPLSSPDDAGIKVTLNLVASAASAKSIVTFSRMKVGPAELNALTSCDAQTLKATRVTNAGGFGIPSLPTSLRLLGLRDDSGKTDQSWPWHLRFVDAVDPEISAGHAHASLLLQLVGVAGLERGEDGDPSQEFRPLGLRAGGQAWPFNPDLGFHTVCVSQVLPVDDQWSTSGLTRHWALSLDLPGRLIHEWWNREVTNPVTTALNVIQQGRPFTTLPILPAGESLPPWSAIVRVFDDWQRREVKKANCQPGVRDKAPAKGTVTIIPCAVTPGPRADVAPGKAKTVAVTYPCIVSRDDKEVTLPVALLPGRVPVRPPGEASEEVEDAFCVSFRLQPSAASMVHPDQFVRMGALDLALPAGDAGSDVTKLEGFEWSESENAIVAVPLLSTVAGRHDYGGIRFRKSRTQLPITAIDAGSQDDMVGDTQLANMADSEFEQDAMTSALLRPTRPLVLSESQTSGTNSATSTVRYRLHLHEVIQHGTSQTIEAQIHQSKSGSSKGVRALVLDSQPFLVCMVSAGAIERATDLDLGTEIANWSNREGQTAWEVRNGAGRFALVLPPQGIGEAMHRRAEDGDVIPGVPIDFRFTPPAVARLRAGDLTQRFTEPAWNLRRLLNTPGFSAGVPVDRIDVELFYGIAATLEPRGLRLAEVTARSGRMAGPLPIEMAWRPAGGDAKDPVLNAYSNVRTRWARLLRGARTRLAVFELWSPLRELTGSELVKTSPLTVTKDDGLSFRLRPSARLRYPIPNREPKDLPPEKFPEIPQFFPDGLQGGWSWGFESRNILEAVRARPRSTSGSLTGLFLSAVGGWGQQKASFDNDKTTIHAMVSMGRTATINIERIGRIGVFWNRAKHVIVYERTVAPSRQFFLEQHPLVGNPVLRKVDEYVELIEDEREFPDKDAPAASRGFVRGLRFAGGPPARIRVNSRWGQDVGEIGWKIPLWMRSAVPEDVYPKPAIYVLNAGATPDEKIPAAIDNPDDVWFFTSTETDTTSDSDTWAPVEGVDFSTVTAEGLRPPKVSAIGHPRDFGKGKDEQDTLARRELGSFTFALEPSAAPANLTVDRTPTAIRALPRSVSMMRGLSVVENQAKPPDAVPSLLIQQRAQLLNAFAPILQPDGRSTPEQALAAFRVEIEKQKNSWAPIFTHLRKAEQHLCDALGERIGRQFDLFASETRLQVVSALQQALSVFLADVDEIFKEADVDRRRAHLLDHLFAISGAAGSARQAIQQARGTVGEVLHKLEDVRAAIVDASSQVIDLVQTAMAQIDALPDWSSASRKKAGAALAGVGQRWERHVLPGPLDFVIGEAVRGWAGQSLDSVRSALNAGRPQLVQLLRDAIKDLETAGSAAAILERLEELSDKALETFDAATEKLDAWVEEFDGLTTTELEAPLDRLDVLLADAIEKIDETTTAAAFKEDIVAATDQLFESLDTTLDSVVPAARAAVVGEATRICKAIIPSLQDLEQQLRQIFESADLNWNGKFDADARKAVEAVLARLSDALGWLVDRARVSIPELNLPVPSRLGDNIVRLLRSFGDVPKLPNLDFNLPQIGYYFVRLDDVKFPGIDLSPVAALANKYGSKLLNSIDISLPTTQLFDRVVPHDLPKFDLSKLFPNFAGLKLDGLFKGLKAPGSANSGVRVTHGIDEQTRTAWMQADIDMPLGSVATVFEIAGVKLTLKSGRFRATARIEARAGESPRQISRGAIQGDWAAQVGGMAIAELRACTLRFDEAGKIHFDITPSQVQLEPPLNFLSKLFEPFNAGDKGFSIAIQPSGVRVLLMLPLPDIQAGTFGVAHLSLGFLFELMILPRFAIRVGLLLSRRERPFTLTVFVLGGAGSLLFGVTYVPLTGEFITELQIAIFASASLAISLGVVSGGVYAYFGVTVEYQSSSRGATSLYYGLTILFIGEVCLLGFISINLTLGLEAIYKGNALVGRGFVSCTIKICWCVTISVNAAVEYEFGSGKSSSSSDSQIQTAADEYLGMF